MPPRKSAQTNVETPAQTTASVAGRHENVSKEVQRSLARWTDEQEIALLKGIVRWKPVGMHKHFRIIAIHNYMISQGVVSAQDEHTTIPGLWTKLGSLYNLPILDEREDSILNSSSDENASPGELYHPFDLADSEFSALKFERRINLDGSESPALINSRRESTVADTDEPRSSPAPGRRGGRAATARRGRRVSKLQQEVGKSQRTTISKAASTTEDGTMEDAREDERDEDGGTEDGDDDQASASRSSARGRGSLRGRAGRGRGSARSRGRRK